VKDSRSAQSATILELESGPRAVQTPFQEFGNLAKESYGGF